MKFGGWPKIAILAVLVTAAVVVIARGTDDCGDNCSVAAVAPAPAVYDVSPAEASALVEAKRGMPGFTILDIRTPAEFAEEHIEGASNFDYYSESFRQQVAGLDRNGTYLVYCRTGRRSSLAMPVFADLGFARVYHLAGGIAAWKSQGLPTTN